MEKSTGTDNTKIIYQVTYPEAVASSEAKALRSQTKLLVEADDLMDAVFANLALKLFILLRIKI